MMTVARRIEPSDFRDSVGEFATGVTVVTTGEGEGAAGMTLNSFTSVSLEPLLVLVSLAHGTRTLETLRASGTFGISILHRWQRETALRFARRGGPFPDFLVEERDGFLFVPGSLARIVEQLTPMLISVNSRYKVHAGIKLTGLPDADHWA